LNQRGDLKERFKTNTFGVKVTKKSEGGEEKREERAEEKVRVYKSESGEKENLIAFKRALNKGGKKGQTRENTQENHH